MKKNFCLTLLISALLLSGVSALAKTPSQTKWERGLAQKITQVQNDQQKTYRFLKELAKEDPAKLANFLLGGKFTYVYDETIRYIGIREDREVLVICQIDDFEVGTFFYSAHKKGNKVTEESTATPPGTDGFVTLWERAK